MDSSTQTKIGKASAIKYIDTYVRNKKLANSYEECDEETVCCKGFFEDICNFLIAICVVKVQIDFKEIFEANIRAGIFRFY